jgi:hypothetical protein
LCLRFGETQGMVQCNMKRNLAPDFVNWC